jgi:hypothetical protein
MGVNDGSTPGDVMCEGSCFGINVSGQVDTTTTTEPAITTDGGAARYDGVRLGEFDY